METKPENWEINAVDFGEGRVIVMPFTQADCAGVILKDAGGPHKIGDYQPGDGPETTGPHTPTTDELYLRFKNVESLDLFVDSLMLVRRTLVVRASEAIARAL